MKWPVPLLMAYLLLALESPVREALRLGPTSASPSLVLPFVVFIALFASSTAAIWTALLLGLAVDLTTLRGEPAVAVAGPHALGFTAAAWFVLSIRSMVMRRNPLALAALSIVAGLIVSLIVVVLFTVRRTLWGGSGPFADGFGGTLGGDLWQRIIGSLYTGATGLVLSALFLPLHRFFGFQDHSARRPFISR